MSSLRSDESDSSLTTRVGVFSDNNIKKKFNSEVIIIWEDEYRDNREDVLDRIERYIILYKQYKKDGIIL